MFNLWTRLHGIWTSVRMQLQLPSGWLQIRTITPEPNRWSLNCHHQNWESNWVGHSESCSNVSLVFSAAQLEPYKTDYATSSSQISETMMDHKKNQLQPLMKKFFRNCVEEVWLCSEGDVWSQIYAALVVCCGFRGKAILSGWEFRVASAFKSPAARLALSLSPREKFSFFQCYWRVKDTWKC